jgi:hypothetical protein
VDGSARSIVGSEGLFFVAFGLAFRALFVLFFIFDLFHAEDLLAFLLFEFLFDVLLVLSQLGEEFELEGVDAAVGLFDLLDHLLHGRLDLGGEDDLVEQFLVGRRGLVDAGAGAEDAVPPLVEGLPDLGGV